MKLHYFDKVTDRHGESMRVKVVLEGDGEGSVYVHRIIDADGAFAREAGETEDAYDVREIVARTATPDWLRIHQHAEERYAELLEQEEAFAMDIRGLSQEESADLAEGFAMAQRIFDRVSK